MSLLYSLLTVTGVVVISSPIAWLILKIGNKVAGDTNKKNNHQAKRNKV